MGCIFIRVTRLGSYILRILGVKKTRYLLGFKNKKIYTTLSFTNVSVNLRMTKLKGFIM